MLPPPALSFLLGRIPLIVSIPEHFFGALQCNNLNEVLKRQGPMSCDPVQLPWRSTSFLSIRTPSRVLPAPFAPTNMIDVPGMRSTVSTPPPVIGIDTFMLSIISDCASTKGEKSRSHGNRSITLVRTAAS